MKLKILFVFSFYNLKFLLTFYIRDRSRLSLLNHEIFLRSFSSKLSLSFLSDISFYLNSFEFAYTRNTGYIRLVGVMETFGSFSFLKTGWHCDEWSLCLADIPVAANMNKI